MLPYAPAVSSKIGLTSSIALAASDRSRTEDVALGSRDSSGVSAGVACTSVVGAVVSVDEGGCEFTSDAVIRETCRFPWRSSSSSSGVRARSSAFFRSSKRSFSLVSGYTYGVVEREVEALEGDTDDSIDGTGTA